MRCCSNVNYTEIPQRCIFLIPIILLFSAGLIRAVWFCFCLFQGHPAGKSERSSLSLAAQLLLCQQPLLIPGLFLHCAAVHYAVLTATPPHSSACSTALQPLLRAMAGRGPWLTSTPHQPLNFVERKVWTACLIFQSQSLLLFALRLSAFSA